MLFQLDFKDPYHNIRMRLGNAFDGMWFVGLFSAFWPLFSLKGWGVVKLFWINNASFAFPERDFSPLNLLNH